MIPAISALAIGLCLVAFALFLPKKDLAPPERCASANPDLGRIIDWKIVAVLTGLFLLFALNLWGVLPMAFGGITAVIAKRRGHSPAKWWVYGSLLFIVALPYALLLEDKTKRKCSFCREPIDPAAVICPRCGNDPCGTPATRLKAG
jgi:hypothetical protein